LRQTSVNSWLTLWAPSNVAITPPAPTSAAPAPSPSSPSSSLPGATGRMSDATASASAAVPARTASSASRSAVVPLRSEPPTSAVTSSAPRSATVATSVAFDFST